MDQSGRIDQISAVMGRMRVLIGRRVISRLAMAELGPILDLSDLDVLRAQLEQLALRPEVLVLRVVGDGRHFCSGFNIAAIDGDAAAAAAAGVGFEALALTSKRFKA